MPMNKKLAIVLVLLFAVLMSVPWLVPHMGWLALVGFVPLLCLDRIASLTGQKHFFWWQYAAFVLWNAITTFWVCNATVGGAVFAVLANAAQMALIWALFRLSKKKFSGVIPYIFLAVMWIAWERQYFDAQISWPWLTLGNAFARTTSLVQWYELTGSLGGSLWIWAVNLGVFGLMTALSDGSWQCWNGKARLASALGLGLVLAGPVIASEIRYANYEEDSCGKVDVLIAQPNFDPYQKFHSMTQAQQNEVLLDLLDCPEADGRLLIAPETFTGDIWLNYVEAGPTVQSFREFLAAHPSSDLLFGASTYRFYDQYAAPSPLARSVQNGGWTTSHNSALLLGDSRPAQIYHKSKLVVGTELTPYPKLFVPIDDKLGGVMGRCEGQKEISLLNYRDSIPFGCAVCYESVYGEYATDYVRKGAEFLTVITNDAWWGDTPGYRQHLSYSSLRAIELRRDVARCGNTGISAIIDQKGDIIEQTQWWQPATIVSSVNRSRAVTPFVRYGDVVGRICTLAFLLLAAALLVSLFKVRR